MSFYKMNRRTFLKTSAAAGAVAAGRVAVALFVKALRRSAQHAVFLQLPAVFRGFAGHFRGPFA